MTTRRAATAFLALLLLGGIGLAQAPPVDPRPPVDPKPPVVAPPATAPPAARMTASPAATVPAGTLVVLDATASAGDAVLFDTDFDESLYAVDTGGRKAYFATSTPGSYPFKLDAFGLVGGKIQVSRVKVMVTVLPPAQPPPAPVTPPVNPPVNPPVTPPVPPVTPPAVVPPAIVGNMRVLLLYETSQPITPAQRAVIYSTAYVVPYLEKHCIKNTAGVAEWRFWDKDVNVANAPPEWQDALAQAKAEATPLPKMVVFAGNKIVGTRAIVSEADTLAFLKGLGGD